MTTFQDQPPQSRRAVRQSERDGATGAQAASGDVPVTPPQPSFVQQPALQPPVQSQPAAQPVQSTPVQSQPAPQQPAGSPQSHAAPPVTGRRSRAASPSGLVDMPTTPPYPGSEPLNYTTQGAVSAQQTGRPEIPAQPTDAQQPAFRVRDFSPEASRRGPFFPQTTPVPDAAPLDYRTQAGPAVTAAPSAPLESPGDADAPSADAASTDAASADAASASANPPVSLTPTGTPVTASGTPLIETPLSATGTPLTATGSAIATTGTALTATGTALTATGTALTATGTALTATGTPEVAMTRRELRAQQAERDAAAARASGTGGVPALVEPAAPTSTLSTAMAEFEALTRAAQGVAAPLPAVAPAESSEADISGSDSPDESPESERESENHSEPASDPSSEPTAAPESNESPADSTTEDEAGPSYSSETEAAIAAATAAAEEEKVALAEAAELQRSRAAAASAQAAAQAEAASRAREEAKQQSELTAQRAFEAEQATRARLAEAAQAAQAQEAQAQEVHARDAGEGQAQSAPEHAPATPADPLAAILGSGTPPVSAAAASSAPSLLPEPVLPPPAAPIIDPLNPAFIAPDLHQTGSHATSTGHWSRQAEIDDETQQTNENPLSRDVGGGNVATTTSALVLPAIPAPVDFGTIISGTGEILVTGSIELPRSLGSTGGDQRRYDDPDVDNLFDAFDNEIISTDSAPVRAIRAVSTHTSTHGVIANNKPKNGNRMLIILLVSTVTLAVVVVGLLAVAANLFP